VRQTLEAPGLVPVGSTPEEFAAFIARETDKDAKVIKTANIRAD
jgi:tripartite-type tricarboxylate transporter receptor subunit TctC